MTRTVRTWGSTLAVIALTLGVAACGGDDDSADDDTTTTTTTTVAEEPTASGPDEGTATTEGGATTEPATGDDAAPTTVTDEPAATTPPAQGCERLPESADGTYPVRDAGEVTISFDGTTVTLVEARPAEGWSATDDTEDDDDEVEVTFRRDGREVDFEAEVDDGRLEVDVCED